MNGRRTIFARRNHQSRFAPPSAFGSPSLSLGDGCRFAALVVAIDLWFWKQALFQNYTEYYV